MTNNTPPNWRAGRLTHAEVARVIGVNFGTLAKMQSKGADFPKVTAGTFNRHEILTWLAKTAPVTDTPPSARSPVIGLPESLK